MASTVTIDHWKTLISSANSRSNENDLDEAISIYEQAKACARTLFAKHPNDEAAIAALVVSFHNLAEAYEKLDQKERAREELADVNSIFRDRIRSTDRDDAVLPILQSAIHRTHFALLHHDETNSVLHQRHKKRVAHEDDEHTAYKRDHTLKKWQQEER